MDNNELLRKLADLATGKPNTPAKADSQPEYIRPRAQPYNTEVSLYWDRQIELDGIFHIGAMLDK